MHCPKFLAIMTILALKNLLALSDAHEPFAVSNSVQGCIDRYTPTTSQRLAFIFHSQDDMAKELASKECEIQPIKDVLKAMPFGRPIMFIGQFYPLLQSVPLFRDACVHGLSMLDSSDWQNFLEFYCSVQDAISQTCKGNNYTRDPTQQARVMANLAKVQPVDRFSFSQFLNQQLKENYTPSGASWVVRAVVDISPENYENVSQCAPTFLQPPCVVSGQTYHRADLDTTGVGDAAVLQGLSCVRRGDFDDVVRYVSPYMSSTLSFEHRGGLIEAFASVSATQREAFVRTITPLLNQLGDENLRAWTIEALATKACNVQPVLDYLSNVWAKGDSSRYVGFCSEVRFSQSNFLKH